MNPWPFVVAAYALVIAGTIVLTLASLVAMRKAERQAEELTRR